MARKGRLLDERAVAEPRNCLNPIWAADDLHATRIYSAKRASKQSTSYILKKPVAPPIWTALKFSRPCGTQFVNPGSHTPSEGRTLQRGSCGQPRMWLSRREVSTLPGCPGLRAFVAKRRVVNVAGGVLRWTSRAAMAIDAFQCVSSTAREHKRWGEAAPRVFRPMYARARGTRPGNPERIAREAARLDDFGTQTEGYA